ncbi:MAG: flagellar protein FlaG [Clostridiales bacterium]|nr:flagellar protein FlaG [Clostridiales bacterium]
MEINSIKNSLQFQDVQKTNLRTTNTSSSDMNVSVEQVMKAEIASNFNEEQCSETPDEQRIKSAVKHANSQMKLAKTRCEFSYNEPTKRVSIKVIDKETEEVIREIPPEETLEMVEKMWELAGILVDERR